MQVQVNGETLELAEPASIDQLVQSLDLAAERIAVELNQTVVRRANWPTTLLKDGDRIEIVHFVGGGSQLINSELLCVLEVEVVLGTRINV